MRSSGSRSRERLGWAIGAWFTPVINLWRPRRITLEMMRASSPDAASGVGTGLINAWWAAWVAQWAAPSIGVITGQTYSLAFRVLSEALPVLAAVLVVIVVQRLTALQRARVEITALTPAGRRERIR
ncbi:DUF4328 domain-containing protein [Streptomyces sp. NPDC001795]|uniref:DUF4328 domain-containing protein n=1 Tax=unclassified Streptomyces TaxID=2593676 RepID=UPI00331E90D4